MPGYRASVGDPDKRPLLASVQLHVKGDWSELTDEQKAAWNKATAAVDELLDLYVEEYRKALDAKAAVHG